MDDMAQPHAEHFEHNPSGADSLTPTKPGRCAALNVHCRCRHGYGLLLGSRSLSMFNRIYAGRIGERRLRCCESC
jgi:hypothetical protein